MNSRAQAILDFWFVETPSEKRFKKDEKFDHEMAYHFMELYLQEHPGLVDIKKFWKDHTKAIKRFNRYPHRNKILGRESTKQEIEFLNGPNSSW